MTNKEFYFDNLSAALLRVSCCLSIYYHVFGENCIGNNCEDCIFSSMESIENWLNAEHVEPEPPLLENGDGLKPGGEILVKNSNYANWEREKFLCYLDGLFFTTYNLDLPYSPEEFRAACWRYARLPEDGE